MIRTNLIHYNDVVCRKKSSIKVNNYIKNNMKVD